MPAEINFWLLKYRLWRKSNVECRWRVCK